jgi:hypothetical protein
MARTRGKRRCSVCYGDRTVICPECQGTGRQRGRPNPYRCGGCQGRKAITCERCQGTGQEPYGNEDR